MPEIERTNRFVKKLKKMDKSVLEKVEKSVKKIINNPEIGKPMKHNRKGTRELYIESFRLSYSYYKKDDKIIFLDLYHKDKQ